MEFVDKNILKLVYIIKYYIYYKVYRVNGVEELEFGIIFYVPPISDVLKIEHCRFSAFPGNKKPVLTGFRVNQVPGMRI